ncbi:MAG: peptidoglycan DD-metalloendopeptidase family protein [Bacillota bacterium]|nr:peptidoglycan DD-metalloendopeptidase family protein [Bacillota bacterium]
MSKNHNRPSPRRSAIDNFIDGISKQRILIAGVLSLALIVVSGMTMMSALQSREEKYAEYQLEVEIPRMEVAGIADKEEVNTKVEVSHEWSGDLPPKVDSRHFAAIPVFQIVVDQYVAATFPSKAMAEELLERLKKRYVPEENELLEVTFSEKVEIVSKQINSVEFQGFDAIDEVLAFIEKGTKEERKHKVQKGENYWTIAQIYGIEPEDLEAANPDIQPEALQIDQLISLTVPKPIISVTTVEQVNYTDNIEFDVVYEDNSSLYIGESRTKSNGIYGEKAIVANIIRENGVIVRQETISEEVLFEPVAKVVYRGTMEPPPAIGTGYFARPLAGGYVSSEFGESRGWYRHTGIDVAVPEGTPIVAADGGVVVASGYSGSYGYRIIIDHGANITTLYAHNSALLVDVGENVFKGQTIAYSGNTGWSTGPHLHFEYRINGYYQNPRDYINF